MLKSSLCNYSDAYILVRGRITTTEAGDDAAARQVDGKCKGVIFKNSAPFTNCKSEINNSEIDNAKDIAIVMPMCNLMEHSDNNSKSSRNLWKYYKGQPNDNLPGFESFKCKIKITGNTPADGNTKDIEITIPLKNLNNFWRTLESH